MESIEPISLIVLIAAVFGASMLQAATGIGYGVIAGPVFLVMLSGTEALQTSILHNLLIAMILSLRIWKSADFEVLRIMGMGALIGLPTGHLIVSLANGSQIKIFAAIVVGVAAIVSFVGVRNLAKPKTEGNSVRRIEPAIVGVASGLLTYALAMPGPLAAAWMALRGWKMEAVRSTILVFFLFAFGSALAMQLTLIGIAPGTWLRAIQLSPLLVLGVIVGNFLSTRISEFVFRITLAVVLSATVVALVLSI